ncbi:MAG TPA: hypothetical protein VKR06_44480 [Ktedonosporobacter sp.]|nr:hypothetical protein [Ktedonosporobacter sp.]
MMTHEEQIATLERNDTLRSVHVPLQTFRRSYAQILTGEDPWLPLGNFMHQFFGSYKHLRSELVGEPIEIPENLSPEAFQWAVFCAASVEYLCKKYDIPCPLWALNPRYNLDEPWYYAINADLPQVQERLRQTTPEEFARRNIFCGDRTYRNKYEHQGRQGRRKFA